jgi:hypothetical protein
MRFDVGLESRQADRVPFTEECVIEVFVVGRPTISSGFNHE